MRLRHAHWIECLIQHRLLQNHLLDAEFSNRLAAGEGFFGEFGGFFVADVGVEAGDHGEGFFDARFAGFCVGFHFEGAEFDEGIRAVA